MTHVALLAKEGSSIRAKYNDRHHEHSKLQCKHGNCNTSNTGHSKSSPFCTSLSQTDGVILQVSNKTEWITDLV